MNISDANLNYMEGEICMTALDILTLTNQTSSFPMDLKLVCETLGVSVLSYELTAKVKKNIISAYATNGENVAIFYDNSIKNDTSVVRFEIAKQLAHFLKFKNHIHYGNAGMYDGVYDFVAELLIPADALRDVISRLIIPELQSLARIFDVPNNLVKYRLSKLKIKEDIVGYNVGMIEFFVKYLL